MNVVARRSGERVRRHDRLLLLLLRRLRPLPEPRGTGRVPLVLTLAYRPDDNDEKDQFFKRRTFSRTIAFSLGLELH